MDGNSAWLFYALACVIGYLLGSIPFGLVITKLAGLGDIRAIGSGNIGATNVLRTGRKDLALATFVLDSGKAGLAALAFYFLAQAINPALNPPIALLAGAFALVGHCYPVWLKFKGGKGVATYAGLLFAAVWMLGVIAAVAWLAIAFIFRRSSLAALVTAILMPILAWGLNYHVSEVLILATLTILVLWRHRSNIERLLDGTEPKIGQKSKQAIPAEE
jgi:glycerol-3-phosphate acyltransferase PlsY